MEHGQVYSGALKFTISDDEDMLHLSEEIGKMQKPPLPGHRILIWLVRRRIDIRLLLVVPSCLPCLYSHIKHLLWGIQPQKI